MLAADEWLIPFITTCGAIVSLVGFLGIWWVWHHYGPDVIHVPTQAGSMKGSPRTAHLMGWELKTSDGWTTRIYLRPDGERQIGEPTVDQMLVWLQERGIGLEQALILAIEHARPDSG